MSSTGSNAKVTGKQQKAPTSPQYRVQWVFGANAPAESQVSHTVNLRANTALNLYDGQRYIKQKGWHGENP